MHAMRGKCPRKLNRKIIRSEFVLQLQYADNHEREKCKMSNKYHPIITSQRVLSTV